MSTAAAAAPDDAGSSKPKNNLKKIIMLAVAGLLVVGAVGGGVVYFIKKKQAAAAEAAENAEEATAAGPKRDPNALPIFVPLEPFTVNLADKNADRFGQVTVSLEVQTSKVADQVRAFMPAVRSAMLLILASKSADELIVPEGKIRLAHELHLAALKTIGAPTRGVEPPAGLPPAAPAAPVAPAAPKAVDANTNSATASAPAAASTPAAAKVAVAAAAPQPKAPRGDVDPPLIVAVHFSNFIIQ